MFCWNHFVAAPEIREFSKPNFLLSQTDWAAAAEKLVFLVN